MLRNCEYSNSIYRGTEFLQFWLYSLIEELKVLNEPEQFDTIGVNLSTPRTS